MDEVNTDEEQLTVYYDGGCGYCRAEIKWYRWLDRRHRLHWVDISRDRGRLEQHGISYAAAMAELHVVGEAGRHYLGVHSFLAIWSRLPVYSWLARCLARWPAALRGLERLYRKFARWRLRRQKACSVCTDD